MWGASLEGGTEFQFFHGARWLGNHGFAMWVGDCDWGRVLGLLGAGIAGGAINSVAGGGSFIVFPSILGVGVTAVSANATTAVALWPAGLASAWAYRRDLPVDHRRLAALSIVSVLGGGLGARLLLGTSDATFALVLPWLLLAASTIFSVGPRLVKVGRRDRQAPFWLGLAVQGLTATYGGYFGGGMGIVMLATFTLIGMTHIHAMNALKVVLGVLINGVAVVLFLSAGKVALEVALPTAVGAIVGGFGGATLARKVDARWVRGAVLVFAWSLTAWFFWRAYAG